MIDSTFSKKPDSQDVIPPSFLYDLPTNAQGRLTRSALIQELGEKVTTWQLEKRPFVTVYSGSRTGRGADYMRTGSEIGRGIENEGWVAINGGTSPGVMGAVLEQCSRQICLVPELFATNTGAGVSAEGFYPHAVNRIVPDFWERKPGMTVISSGAFFALPGGYGSLDEIFETLVFAAKTNRHLVFVNPDGYWNDTLHLLDVFAAQGLMPLHYKNCYSSAANAQEAIKITKQHAQKPVPLKAAKKKPIATQSLRAFLSENPHVLPDALSSFLKNAPRVGVVASGNIGKEKETTFNISNRTFLARFVSSTSEIGYQFAKAGAALVVIGDRRGLRARIAQSALDAGGKVVWLQKSNTRHPLNIRQIGKKELMIEAPRYFERERLFATIVQSMLFVAGGIHTTNVALSHVTRNQTGHGDYCDLVPHCRDTERPKMIAHAYDPPLNREGLRLWQPLQKQIRFCEKEGFMSTKDLGLLRFHRRPESIVENVLERIDHHPDFLAELSRKSRQTRITSPTRQNNHAQ